MSRPKQTPNKKISAASALKVAGWAQGQAAPPVLETAESFQRMTDSCASKLDGLGNGQLLIARRAPIDLFPYQKSPNFNIGIAFSKRDMYAWK